MTYRAYLIRTMTGEVLARLNPSAGSWDIELNGIEKGSVTVKKSALRKIPADRWKPRAGGILITYTDAWGDERPIVAGPITTWGTETLTDLPLSFEGIRWLFTMWVLNWWPTYTGLSLGTIAWRIVSDACSLKPGGGPPIVHGSAEENANRQRTAYEGWNMANNGIEKRLTELSGVINGPDIMFYPRWVDDTHQRIEWVMEHGSEANPRLIQDYVPVFDMATPRANATNVQVKPVSDHIIDRVWATGAGEGGGTAIAKAENLSRLRQHVPFTEKVISDPDQADVTKLEAKARGELNNSRELETQLTFTTMANRRSQPLGSYRVGHIAQVNVGSGWLSLQEGINDMRVMKMSGDLGSSDITLDFQQDTYD